MYLIQTIINWLCFGCIFVWLYQWYNKGFVLPEVTFIELLFIVIYGIIAVLFGKISTRQYKGIDGVLSTLFYGCVLCSLFLFDFVAAAALYSVMIGLISVFIHD